MIGERVLSEFSSSTPPLVAGSVMGIRMWWFSHYSDKLAVIGYKESWLSSVKYAKCLSNRPYDPATIHGKPNFSYTHPEWDVPSLHCTCGIYAYWLTAEVEQDIGTKEWYDVTRLSPPLLGVIEGSGSTIIGTKGFRTAKAKIMALCIPYSPLPELPLKYLNETFQKDDGSPVPVYSRLEDMLAEYPLTEPPIVL